MLSLIDVSVTYDVGTIFQKPALKNVSLDIKRNERVAIVGRIGSGKSTLIQLLNGLIKPDSGEVLFEGLDINAKNVDIKKVREKVGVVFQYPEEQFFAETVFEEVAFGPRNFGYQGEHLKNAVYTALSDMGFNPEEISTRSPFNLSGGEKRRVAIASIIASNPEVVVLDEPSSGLDFKSKSLLMSYLKKENKKGRTLIIVTHDMAEVLEFAERVIAFKGGVKMFDGSVEQFFFGSNAVYSVGLKMPFLVELQHKLREKYPDFPFCRTADCLVDSIRRRLKREG